MTNNTKDINSYFFTDESFTQGTKSFGPIDSNRFQITTTIQGALNAYAVTSGILLFGMQEGSTDKINILLKPIEDVGLGVKIKYFVYRGITASDIFKNLTGTPLVNDSSSLAFVTKACQAYTAFHQTIDGFEGSQIGLVSGTSGTNTEIIKNFFSKGSYNLLRVAAGTLLGKFSAGAGGFEIVLDDGDYTQVKLGPAPDFIPELKSDTGLDFNRSFITAKETILNTNKDTSNLNLPGVFGASKNNNLEAKIFRESIYNFIDPVAFYGSHIIEDTDRKGTIKVGGTNASYSSKNDIYNNLIFKFKNKNTAYIYIKGKRNRSLNFYDSTNTVKIRSAPQNISDPNWPIIVFSENPSTNGFDMEITNSTLMASVKSTSYLKIKPDNNGNISNDFDAGYLIPRFKGSYLLPFILETGGNKIISSLIYMNYNAIPEKTDILFGPVNLSSIFERADFTNKKGAAINHLSSVLVKENGDSSLYHTKIVLDGYLADYNPSGIPADLTTTLRTYILTPQETTQEFDANAKTDLTAAYYCSSTSDEYIKAVYNTGDIWKGTIKDGTKTITSLLYRRSSFEEKIPVFQIGISQDDYNKLINNVYTIDVNATNFFFNLEDITPLSSSFMKYKLKIQFDKSDGTLGITSDTPANYVIVYTIDGAFFFSEQYSASFTNYKEFPKVTAEFLPRDNYVGEFGFDWLRKGDIDGTIMDKPFNKIIAENFTNVTPPVPEKDGNVFGGLYKFKLAKYLQLKNRSYQSIPVNWKLTTEGADYEKDFSISYLNLYRFGITPNPRAQLRLLIRANQTLSRFYIKYPKDLFAIRLTDGLVTPDTNPIDSTGQFRLLTIPSTQLPAVNTRKLINLEIENLANISKDTEITIHNETDELCGKIVVVKNDEVLSKKIQIVQFKDNMPNSVNTLSAQDAKVRGIPNIDFFLKHANIKVDYEPYMVIDITSDANFSPLHQPNPLPPYTLINPSMGTSNNENLISEFTINMTNTTPVGNASKKAFENHVGAALKNYRNHLIMCYTDRASNTNTKGFAHDEKFMFIPKDIPIDAYAHEVYHALGIPHTFDNSAEYVYMHGLYSSLNNTTHSLTTPTNPFATNYGKNDISDNLMDYFITRKTTYKWQWDIMRKKIREIK
ncbi:hypothetical protein [Chryseobacterium sp. c4a]|uniref:hypothetical protein n=1 Tax=Chryseobacterium sp. c4a TaxID=1573582 RepID=UPI00135BB044|nr:hypothetical protein [Chryseobacterium sp. c4a]